MPRTKYLLTINNQPATFIGGQICYARNRYRGSGVKESELASSTREARRLIRKSIDYRISKGWEEDGLRYGYTPIRLGV